MVVFYCRFDAPLSNVKWSQHLSKLPEDITTRILKYRRWQDRHSALFGKLLVLEGFKFLGISPDALKNLQYSKYGRPSIPGSIDFNISHSHQYVVCAFSESGDIGIDIEYIRDSLEIEDFRNVLTQSEWDHLQSLPDKNAQFFEYWCKKESIIKADGRGFSAPVLNIELLDGKAMFEQQTYHLREIQIPQDYKAFVARSTPIDQIQMIKCNFE